MTREEVDIAVVGAGPAGLCAAIEASGHGTSVVILDRKKIIGHPVKCGEFFVTSDEVKRLFPHAKGTDRLFNIPHEAVAHKCSQLRFLSPNGKEYEFPLESCTLNRARLEAWLAERAEDLGVRIELQTKASVEFSNGSPMLHAGYNKVYRPKVTIAADGFPSDIAASFGLPVREYITPRTVATNYQYSMSHLRIEPGVTEMYYNTSVSPGGYAWIIPKGDNSANVGMGIRTAYYRQKARPMLEYFIEAYPPSRERLQGGVRKDFICDVLPVDGPIARTYGTWALACGDAAGMVMPTNGGGIQTAMITGKIAGETAAEHVLNGLPLHNYEAEWRRQIGNELQVSRTVRRAADFFMYKNALFENSLHILGAGGIRDVITCNTPRKVAPIIRVLAALMARSNLHQR